MSDGPPAPETTLDEARPRRSRWIGIVWAVPLAALLIVAFLGVRALADRGIEIVITFDSAAGVRIDDTKVIYQGIEGGTVKKIDINPDGRQVDVTVRMDPRAKPVLTTKTTFWMVGVKPNLSDFTSVKAAVAGPYIALAPSTEGEPARKFRGLSEPPIVLPGTPGTAYVLAADRLATARAGSAIYYRGQDIGRVTAARFIGPGSFKLDIFIQAPYDRLIGPAASFWISSPVDVSLTSSGATAGLRHAQSLLNGAVEFETFDSTQAPARQSAAGSEFALYSGRDEARDGPDGPEVPYAFEFDGPAGELDTGTAVQLHGFKVGAVTSVRLRFDDKTARFATAVRAVLYPQRLRLAPPAGATAAQWRSITDAALTRLLAQGYRAQLAQKPPLIGRRIVVLERGGSGSSSGPAATLVAGDPPRIPSAANAGSVDDMTRQANEILAKVNRLPIEAIGTDVRQITSRLSALVSSPQVSDSLNKLDSALTQVDRLLADVRPQVQPLLERLNRVADELSGAASAARALLDGGSGGAVPDASLPDAIRDATDAARSVRALSDYLRRHPESLLRGRRDDAPKKESR